MADEHRIEDESRAVPESETEREEQPGLLGGRLAPVGARALALAGLAVLILPAISSRVPITSGP